MKPISTRRLLFAGTLAGFAAICAISLDALSKTVQPPDHPAASDGVKLPPEVGGLMRRSCFDCHSNQTVWPAYSYVPPISWLIENDVRRGRERMNFSRWEEYTFAQREKLLADIATVVKNGEMPLPQYTLVHRRAKLTGSETDLIYGWARGERRKLREAARR